MCSCSPDRRTRSYLLDSTFAFSSLTIERYLLEDRNLSNDRSSSMNYVRLSETKFTIFGPVYLGILMKSDIDSSVIVTIAPN